MTLTPQKHLRRAPPASASSRQCNAPLPILFEEIIVEILSWLPVKSLLQFRRVCKSWKSLIFDPQFVKLHLRRSATKADFTNFRLLSLSYADNPTGRLVSYSLGSLFNNPSSSTITVDVCMRGRDYEHYRVVGSCNGLLCLTRCLKSKFFSDYRIHILNPIRKFGVQRSIRNFPLFNVIRESDQYGSPDFAFGYDQLSETYKVIVVLFDRSAEEDLQKTLVKVHNMGDTDNSWRNIRSFPAVPINAGQFLNGSLNWVAVRNCSGYRWNYNVTIDQLVIVSLDLGNETYRQLLLPQDLDEVPHVEPTLGVLRDCLCFSHDYKRSHFVVWKMNEFGVQKSWTRLVNVSYLDLQTSCLEFRSILLPMCMSEAGNVLMVSRNERFTDSRVILYNSRDDRVVLSEILNNTQWFDPQVYVESLVLPR